MPKPPQPLPALVSYLIRLHTHPPQHSHFHHVQLLLMRFLHRPCLGGVGGGGAPPVSAGLVYFSDTYTIFFLQVVQLLCSSGGPYTSDCDQRS